ncbi:MAG: metallophosphoesterase [Isosphaeraceae bacterium]
MRLQTNWPERRRSGARKPDLESLESRQLLSHAPVAALRHAVTHVREAAAERLTHARSTARALAPQASPGSWSFAVIGDTRDPRFHPVGTPSEGEEHGGFLNGRYVSGYLGTMCRAIAKTERVKFAIHTGDLVRGDLYVQNTFGQQFKQYAGAVQPLLKKGIDVIPVLGNHEDYFGGSAIVQPPYFPWVKAFRSLTQAKGSPVKISQIDEYEGQNFMFSYGGALFVGLNTYPTFQGHDNDSAGLSGSALDSLDRILKENQGKQLFVFGHAPLVSYATPTAANLDQNLDAESARADRDRLLRVMTEVARPLNDRAYYLTGHIHMYDRSLITTPDYGRRSYQVEQLLVGSGGAEAALASQVHKPHGTLAGSSTKLKVDDEFLSTSSIVDPRPRLGLQADVSVGYAIVTVTGSNVKVVWKEYDPATRTFVAKDSASFG